MEHHPKEQSSYRGELGGILPGIVYTNRKCKENSITCGKVVFGCDSKGALAASFGWKTPNPNWVCFDLVSMIRYHLRSSNIQWEGKHIKGHQDDRKKFEHLSIESQANVIADKCAKEELRRRSIALECNQKKGQPWKAVCRGQVITGNAEDRLRYTMQEQESKTWWTKKLLDQDWDTDKIQWDVYVGYRKATPRWRNTWAIKYGAGILPTKRNMKIRKHSEDQSCPCCGAETENTIHLFQCQDDEIQKTFDDEVDKIEDYLSVTTSNTIKTMILTTLQHLRNGTMIDTTENSAQDKIVYDQLQLGQRATLNGMWMQGWVQEQEIFLQRIRSRKHPKVWLINLSLLLQTMTHNMWKTRNEAIHKKEDSAMNKQRHEELDQDISNIFRDRPHYKLLPPCDAAFFRKGQERVKRYRVRKKEHWVTDAKRILEAYNDSLDATSEAFLDFFVIPANRT